MEKCKIINMIDSKLTELKRQIKLEAKSIINQVLQNYINRNTSNAKIKEICLFCNSSQNLTREHVLPKWAFNNSPTMYFNTDINGLKQKYISSTIPTCKNCNNNLLGSLEKYIINLFESKSNFSSIEKQNIIRWLEIIEYKFQILDVRKKFVVSKEFGHISYLADFPISVLRESNNFSPTKVISQIRNSLKRITIKSKKLNENSLVIFKSKNTSYDFFHSVEGFIFLEIPEFNIAIFYFYSKIFENNFDAYNEAIIRINEHYTR
jgi:hypothetical protein